MIVTFLILHLLVIVEPIPIISREIPDIVVRNGSEDEILYVDIPHDAFLSTIKDGSISLSIISNYSFVSSELTYPIRIGGAGSGGGETLDVFASDYLYIADIEQGFYLYDVRNPSSPEFQGIIDDDLVEYVGRVHADENDQFAYLAALGKGLVIVDVQVKNAPYIRNSHIGRNSCLDVFVVGDYCYTAYNGNFVVYRVTDKDAVVSIFDDEYGFSDASAYTVFVDEDRAYVGTDTLGLRIYEISPSSYFPEDVTYLGTYEKEPVAAAIYSVFVRDRIAFLGLGENGYVIINTTDGTDFILLSQNNDVPAIGVFVKNNLLFIAGGDTEDVQAYDISDLQNPRNVWGFSEYLIHPYNIYERNNTLFIADGSGAVKILDYGDLQLSINVSEAFSNITFCGNISYPMTLVGEDEEGRGEQTIYLKIPHCSDYGECVDGKACVCRGDGYSGLYCEFWECYGAKNNVPNEVCSGHGRCVDIDHCACDPHYYGEVCNITRCGDYLSNDTSRVCSGKGTCDGFDECTCEKNYFYGYDRNGVCNYTSCDGLRGGDVCSGMGVCWPFDHVNTRDLFCAGHGDCVLLDTCSCDENYYSMDCSITTCNGTFSNQSAEVCSSMGICTKFDHCDCAPYYYGEVCDIVQCFGYFSNDTSEVCMGFGNCVSPEICQCNEKFFGEVCNVTICGGVFSNDSSVCSSHGECELSDDESERSVCDCFGKWYDGPYCGIWSCFGEYNYDDEKVCSGHGDCLDHDVCNCTTGNYSGDRCQIWTCFGRNQYVVEEKACSGHGDCLDVDVCRCEPGYEYRDCRDWTCGGYDKNDNSSVCNQRGICVAYDECSCVEGYEGNLCETWSCGFDRFSDHTCNGHGDCIAPAVCECDDNYSGKYCDKSLVFTRYGVPSLISGLIIFCCLNFLCVLCILFCLCFCVCISFCVLVIFGFFVQRTRATKYRRLKSKFDFDLQENLIDNEISIQKLKINKEMFNIDMSTVKILGVLGEGGSRSIVYKGKWNNLTIAFKCFRVRHIASCQNDFDQFAKEVSLFASIHHPHIVRFYGCSFCSPRVGIIMEYCENGELTKYFHYFKLRNKKRISLEEKIRMMKEIISPMIYLHERNIIHRDLKSENVLVDSGLTCKLTDFGLSRVSERGSQTKTQKIGTAIYMSPEIISTNRYGLECDVYSFGILLWVIVCEKVSPYGNSLANVQFRVAMDPSFRPSLKVMRKYIAMNDVLRFDSNNVDDVMEDESKVCGEGESVSMEEEKEKLLDSTSKKNEEENEYSWICKIAEACWKHDCKERPTFVNIQKMFEERKYFE